MRTIRVCLKGVGGWGHTRRSALTLWLANAKHCWIVKHDMGKAPRCREIANQASRSRCFA